MKKFVSLALALVLVLALSVTVFAAGFDAITADGAVTGGNSQNVTINVTPLVSTDKYAAVITWELNEVTYAEGTRVWDTDKMEWGETTGAAWSDSAAGTVAVQNKSSKPISATVAETSDYLTLDKTGAQTVDSKATTTWTVTASGTPATGSTAAITVTIAAVVTES